MTTVAVTGASGYLGRVLLSQLDAAPDVTRVVGIDRAEPTSTARKLEFYRMDVRSPDLARVVRGCDVLVHLAFTVEDDDAEMRDVNIGGTRLALEAAISGDVRRIVYASSVMVYGAHPDNDFPLTELSPVRPARDLPYSAHNAESEEVVRAFAATHPDLTTTVLRFSPVLGPTLAGTGVRFVESPYAFALQGYDVPGQALHEDDAARALAAAALADATTVGELKGIYNVCPDDWTPASEVASILGQRQIELDPRQAHSLGQRVWRQLGDLPAAMTPFLMYPWIASNGKLRATGFSVEHSSADALRAGAEARKGWVSLGKVRFRPRRMALIGGTVGAVLLSSAFRQRAKRGRSD